MVRSADVGLDSGLVAHRSRHFLLSMLTALCNALQSWQSFAVTVNTIAVVIDLKRHSKEAMSSVFHNRYKG
jgi:hypothetical protein